MTAADLIARLQELPPDTLVLVGQVSETDGDDYLAEPELCEMWCDAQYWHRSKDSSPNYPNKVVVL